MKLKTILPLIFLILLLTACQVSTSPTLSPTPTPDTLASVEQASTPTTIANPPATETPEVEPALTEPVPTENTFIVDAPVTESSATEDSVRLIALVMAASHPEVILSSISPDRQWQADIVRYDCVQVDSASSDENAYEQIVITRLSDSMQTVVAEQLQYCGGLGSWGFNDRYWSPNSRYYYFDEARWGIPDGFICGFWYPGFSRVDVETGQLERLPGNGTVVNTDGIMVGWENGDLVLWNLNEGEISRSPFAVEDFTLQSVQMSPEGDRFVYLLVQNCNPPGGRSVVVLYSLADQTHTILVDSDNPSFVYAMWENASLLLLLDTNGYQWHYDLDANELIPITSPVTPPAPQ